MKKPNLLILGASGGVANSVLHYFIHHRRFFNKLFLLDKSKKILSDPYIDHDCLNYKFIHYNLDFPKKESEYISILKKNKIDIVLDITDYETLPLIEATNKAKVSYINTAMNSETAVVTEMIYYVYSRKKDIANAPHILCTGMNPGNVNMWVRHGIEKFGVPDDITHFEYDTSKVATKWKPMMTWSVHEFLVESVRDPTGIALGRDRIKELHPDALKHRVDMKNILSPILKLPKYPRGFTVLHEENVSIAQKYDVPSKFIYAVNMQTMELLEKIYAKKKDVSQKDLILGDNTNQILEGSDSIGVILDYPDKKVYYFNTIPNIAVVGTSATYTQVAIGIFSALCTLLFDKIPKGINFVEDLYGSYFKYFMFDNMRVQEFVFKKSKSGSLKLKSYIPEIKLKRNNHLEHVYIT